MRVEEKQRILDNPLWEGALWCRCGTDREDCPDRQGVSSYGRPPVCEECLEPLETGESHYHLVQKTLAARLCQECWTRATLPAEDESTNFRFLTDPNYQ